MSKLLAERNALVTGASRGIGRAIALAYAAQGANVALLARTENALREVAGEVQSLGGHAHVLSADVTEPDAVAAAIDALVTTTGSVDILVNNAGIYDACPFMELTRERWQRMFDVSVTAVLTTSQAVLKHMLPRKSGKIINISSVAGVLGSPFMSSYNAAKAAVLSMTRCMAMEFMKQEIVVNAICPGMVETEMSNQIVSGLAECLGITVEEFEPRLRAGIPAGRFAKPEEIAEIAVYLAALETNFHTGQAFHTNGARHLA